MTGKLQENEASLEKLTEIAAALDHIKRLLIFVLLRDGVSQSELGTALGMHQSTVSRLIPGAKSSKRKARK